MPLEHLPVEIWHSIIMMLDDYCFAWFVLRQVSPFLASLTEDVFSRYVLRTCSIRFAGQTLRNLLPPNLQGDVNHHRERQVHSSPLLQPPTFCFQPCTFVPADTRAKLVLRLREPATTHQTLRLCEPHAGSSVSSTRLNEVFFKPGVTKTIERNRPLNEAHIVRFHSQLKSICIPSAAVNLSAQELSLDWRRLCDTIMRDTYKCRYEPVSSVAWWRKFE